MIRASDALAIARQGIRGADPARAVRRTLRRDGSDLWIGGHRLRLGPGGELRIVAIGKAAAAMADAAVDRTGRPPAGLAVSPRGYPSPRSGIRGIHGEHPVPGAGSFRAGRALLDYVRASKPNDVVLCLISGGGSAAAEVPAPGLRPTDLARTTGLLLASGAPIGAMNSVRRHLSALKGGWLAAESGTRRLATIAISDVVGDDPADIASGPTVPDPTRFADARRALERYHLTSRVPARVLRHLEEGARGAWPETPKASDPRLRGTVFVLAARNRTAIDAAVAEARRRGFRARVVRDPLVGESEPAGRSFARQLLALAGSANGRRVALVAGGETTVTLGPRPGRGGRNQEFALAGATLIQGTEALVLSVGTDGIDGPTDAAGGWVDGSTVAAARRRSIDLAAALRRHGSYDALAGVGTLLRTGPTGTNVMDLHVGLARVATTRGTAGSSRPRGAPSSRRRRS